MRVRHTPPVVPVKIHGEPRITYRLRRFHPRVLVIPALVLLVGTAAGAVFGALTAVLT